MKGRLPCFKEVGDPRFEAVAHHGLGLAQGAIGERARARESLNRALARIRIARDTYNESQILLSLARLDRDAGLFDQARTHAEAALTRRASAPHANSPDARQRLNRESCSSGSHDLTLTGREFTRRRVANVRGGGSSDARNERQNKIYAAQRS